MIRETILHKSMSRQIGCVKPANPKLSLIYKCRSMAGMRSKNKNIKLLKGQCYEINLAFMYFNGEQQKGYKYKRRAVYI